MTNVHRLGRIFDRRILAFVAVFAGLNVLPIPVCANANEYAAVSDSTKAPRSSLIPFPFYMYSPETKSGVGIVLTHLHRPGNAGADEKPSIHSATVMFTQRKQLVIGAEVDRYGDSERLHLRGGASFSKFPDTFYGIGNDTSKDDSEDYTPRTVMAYAGFGREIAPDLRVGPHVSYTYQEITETEDQGMLDLGTVLGSDGGTLVQVGLTANFDRRDNIVYPRGGALLELDFSASQQAYGSDFNFTQWTADIRKYVSLSSSQVVAVRALGTVMTDHPPFQSLAALGGDRVMRGFYAGRFRERNMYALQAEYRLGFWKRMGLAVFGDLGDVAGHISDFHADEVRFAGGFGLRFLLNRDEGVTLRADIGMGDDGSGGMYFSMLEAY
jgi:hypothetical protein